MVVCRCRRPWLIPRRRPRRTCPALASRDASPAGAGGLVHQVKAAPALVFPCGAKTGGDARGLVPDLGHQPYPVSKQAQSNHGHPTVHVPGSAVIARRRVDAVGDQLAHDQFKGVSEVAHPPCHQRGSDMSPCRRRRRWQGTERRHDARHRPARVGLRSGPGDVPSCLCHRAASRDAPPRGSRWHDGTLPAGDVAMSDGASFRRLSGRRNDVAAQRLQG